jgi:peptidoglycan-N-acetylmuramic acid deacetylase
VEPYIPGAQTAVPAENIPQNSGAENTAGDLAGGVYWPALSAERRAQLSGKTVGWGQGVEVNDKNQPTGALYGLDKYGELGGYFILPDAGNTVYLTYDLGYENGYTAPVLDALKEKGVKGVFFVTMDYVKTAPELVRRIIDEGHVLGNHSVHHPSMPACSAEEAKQEILGLHDYVKENFGYEMTLFRFPRGEFSEKTLVQARDLGYASVFWSYAYVDWKTDAQPEVAASLAKLTKAAHPGAIYLLHTVSSTNAALMGDLIDNLHAAGYTVGLLPH